MSDWQVGDLAVRAADSCPYESHGKDDDPVPEGVAFEVVHVSTWWDGRAVIYFNPAEQYGVRCGGCFRKIRPDEHQACEDEFVTLLRRSKVPETADGYDDFIRGGCPGVSGTVETRLATVVRIVRRGAK